ncbi:MAG: nucleotidyltransferase [Planctomycetes bacterium]|nr:nucleotidyltransferase [Planctomycetota bacterium]
MSGLEDAAAEIAAFLEDRRIAYMVIGGVANLLWGVARSTGDVDVTVWVEETEIPKVVGEAARAFTLLVEDPVGFVARTRVLPVRTRSGFRADLSFGTLPFEREAIERARPRRLGPREIRVCTAEDLVLHKIASERPRDREDVRGILATQGKALDRRYLDPRVEQVARDLERPEILDFYRSALSKP